MPEPRRRHFDFEGGGEVDRAGVDLRAGSDGAALGLAGDEAVVDVGGPERDAPVRRQPVAGAHKDAVAGLQRASRRLHQAAVGAHQRRRGRAQAGEIGGDAARVAPHRGVERAAEQQEEQQHQRAVEIGVLAPRAVSTTDIASASGDAERDRHVHVERAGAQARDTALKKNGRPA